MNTGFSRSDATPLPPGAARVVGLLLLVVGGVVCAVALGWIDYPPAKLRAPREVLLCAGLVFALPGALFFAESRIPKWLGGLAGAFTFTAFAMIPTWVSIGQGPRAFGGSGTDYASLLGFDPGLIGRVAFGAGAVILWPCAAIAWLAWINSLPRVVRLPAALAVVATLGWAVWGRTLEPRANAAENDDDRLARYIAAKHAHRDFKYFAGGGGNNPFLQPPEEAWIKAARARLAAARQVPPDAAILAIPRAEHAPLLDGRVDASEWRPGLRVSMVPAQAGAAVVVMHHNGKLYVAGEAPADRTEKGFDQLRTYFHVDLSSHLTNERVFVGHRGSLSALRSVRTAADKAEKTEWNVLSRIAGASAVAGHRQFELAIDLREAGLDSGNPFPAWLEIEGDPLRDASGRFLSRHVEGRAGSREEPLWLRIAN